MEHDYFFSENGLVAYKQGEMLAVQSLKKFLGEDKLKELINFILHYIADLDIPIKRGVPLSMHMLPALTFATAVGADACVQITNHQGVLSKSLPSSCPIQGALPLHLGISDACDSVSPA
jgi:hypothetical protein